MLFSILKLIRFKNLLLTLLGLVVVQLLLIYNIIYRPAIAPFLHYVVSVITAMAAGNTINNYFDINSDKINKKYDATITQRTKLICYFLLLIISIASGFLISPLNNSKIATLILCCNIFLFLYSYKLKAIPFVGNLIIAVLTGMSIYLLNIVTPNPNSLWITILSCFSFLINLVREIVKDIIDINGDYNVGQKTLPIVLGIHRTKWVIYCINFVLIAITLYTIIAMNGHYTQPYFTLLVLLPCLSIFYFVSNAKQKNEFQKISNLLKLILLLGIFSVFFI